MAGSWSKDEVIADIQNDEAMAAIVSGSGYNPYDHKIPSITAMQKLLGKSRFDELLGSLIEKPQ